MPLSLARSAISLPTSFAEATLPPVGRLSPLMPLPFSTEVGGHDGHTLGIIDHLGINVVHRAINVQPRTLGRAGQCLADAVCTFCRVLSFEAFPIIFFALSFQLSAVSLQQLPATSLIENCHPERSEGPAFLSLSPILTCWATNCFALRAFANCYFAPVLPTFFFRRSLV